jgi:hypothetical protein
MERYQKGDLIIYLSLINTYTDKAIWNGFEIHPRIALKGTVKYK